MMILNNEIVINYIYNQVDKESDYEDENGGNYDIFRSPDTSDAEGFILSPSKYPDIIPLQLVIPFNMLNEFVDTIDSDLLLKIPSPPPLLSLPNDNNNKKNKKESVSCQTKMHNHYVTSTKTYEGKIADKD